MDAPSITSASKKRKATADPAKPAKERSPLFRQICETLDEVCTVAGDNIAKRSYSAMENGAAYDLLDGTTPYDWQRARLFKAWLDGDRGAGPEGLSAESLPDDEWGALHDDYGPTLFFIDRAVEDRQKERAEFVKLQAALEKFTGADCGGVRLYRAAESLIDDVSNAAENLDMFSDGDSESDGDGDSESDGE